MNQATSPIISKKLLAVIVAVTVLFAGYLIFNTVRFHVTSTTPNHKDFPASIGTLHIYFNKELDQDFMKQKLAENPDSLVVPDFESKTTVTIHKDHITVKLAQTPGVGSYTLRLQDITAKSGDVLSTTLPFKVKDIPYDKMNADEKKIFDELASFSADGGENNRDPIADILPYETTDYLIDYSLPNEGLVVQINITMKFFEPGNNAVPATPAQIAEYHERIRTNRKAALAYIDSKGFKLDDYHVSCTELALREEFPTGKPL